MNLFGLKKAPQLYSLRLTEPVDVYIKALSHQTVGYEVMILSGAGAGTVFRSSFDMRKGTYLILSPPMFGLYNGPYDIAVSGDVLISTGGRPIQCDLCNSKGCEVCDFKKTLLYGAKP